jgi:hypothetical protein
VLLELLDQIQAPPVSRRAIVVSAHWLSATI